MSDNRVDQEFYCTVDGGGCGGYIMIRLNKGLNGVVNIICPKCQHQHQRALKDGIVKEADRFSSRPVEDIKPSIAAWSSKCRYRPKLEEDDDDRDGFVVDRDEVIRRNFLEERKFEIHGGKLV